jgi:hypothetical protein
MKSADLVSIRKQAEGAVADMVDGPLKVKAFEMILGSLLAGRIGPKAHDPTAQTAEPSAVKAPSTLPERIDLLAEEGFFGEPKSLGEIQNGLAEHGWHYPQTNLSTPVVRLVRQRRLRRLQLAEGSKRVWKYSLP